MFDDRFGRKVKLVIMLAMLFVVPMIWALALSTADTPLVKDYGLFRCVVMAMALAVVMGWVTVGAIEEAHEL